MRGVAGTLCSMSVLRGDWSGWLPVEGDFLLTAAGSCYRIEEVRPGRDRPVGRLICTRLERNAVAEGDPGVHLWEWAKRPRKRP